MPTSSYQADVKVEIAFNAGFRTAAASRTWTDVSPYVELGEGISISGGRGDERSTADANTLTLTLDNSDGRFTAGLTLGAYYPNVKLYRPIRVKATPVESALLLTGVSPGRASTPDAAALDITGDIDLRAHAALDDWTPPAMSALVGKWLGTGNQRSYLLTVETSGSLRLFWSTAGSVTLSATSTVAPVVSNGAALWVRGTLDVDNGAAGNDVKFYTSTDGVTWTQLGATVTTAGVTSIFAGTAEGSVGAYELGTLGRLAGRVFSAEIRNGIAGTIVANPDFRIQDTGATSFVDSTGKTWTVVSPATIDGVQTLFTGYVTSWPVEWNGTSAYAKATITAVSRLARLGLNAAWRSIIEENYLLDSPAVYYPLGEPEGSTQANDMSGNGAAPLTLVDNPALPVVFGTAIGPGTDGLTAATFANGQYLSAPRATATEAGISVEVFFSSSVLPASSSRVTLVSCGNIHLLQNDNGTIRAFNVVSNVDSASSLTDGLTHHAVATWDGTTLRLYIDGVLAASTASAGTPQLGPVIVGGFQTFGSTFSGVAAHAAAYASTLSAARIAAHADSGSTGHAGELTSARLARYAALAAIPAAEVTAETGSTTMTHVDTTGKNIVEMLRMVETTEGGVLFDGRDGTLTMHNRAHRYARASSFTLDMNQGEVESDYSPRLDPSALANDITAANVAGTFSAHVKDTASILDNGSATLSYTTASQDDDEPLQLASWAKLKYATPRPRVPTLSVDALAQVGKTPNSAAVLAATIGDKVSVENQPDQAPAKATDYFIEGYTISIGPESLRVSWNVSPSSPDDLSLIVGDAIRGVVGTNYVAY